MELQLKVKRVLNNKLDLVILDSNLHDSVILPLAWSPTGFVKSLNSRLVSEGPKTGKPTLSEPAESAVLGRAHFRVCPSTHHWGWTVRNVLCPEICHLTRGDVIQLFWIQETSTEVLQLKLELRKIPSVKTKTTATKKDLD